MIRAAFQSAILVITLILLLCGASPPLAQEREDPTKKRFTETERVGAIRRSPICAT